jgi:hypothetical protein
MFIDYKLYNKPIESYELNDELDILQFKTSSYKYQYQAEGDCCSCSKFFKYKQDFSFVIGKTIKSVKEIDIPEDFKISDVENDFDEYYDDDIVVPFLFEMKFKDTDETFQFAMLHYSNGYYAGWMTGSIVI